MGSTALNLGAQFAGLSGIFVSGVERGPCAPKYLQPAPTGFCASSTDPTTITMMNKLGVGECGILRRTSSKPAPADSDEVTQFENKRLRVLLTTDYPLALAEGEQTSGSAERILDAAIELKRRGHDVFVIEYGYRKRPPTSGHSKFPIHTMIFRPKGKERPPGGAPFLDFDVPLLGGRDSRFSSTTLYSQLGDRQVDRLIMGSMAVARLTSLMFGGFDVVVTAHATSLFNYPLSDHPIVAYVSSSDRIARGTSPKVEWFMREGARRVHSFVSSSFDGQTCLSQLGLTPQLKYPLQDDLLSLIQNNESTSKAELQQRYPELAGITQDGEWVVMYDRAGDSHVLRYFVWLAYEIERLNEKAHPIIVGKYDPVVSCRLMEEKTITRTSHICPKESWSPDDAWQVKRLIGAADAAVVFNVSGELPQMDDQRVQRDMWIASQLAVVSRKHGGNEPTIYLPGCLDGIPSSFLDRVVSDCAGSEVDDDDLGSEEMVTHLRAMAADKAQSWKRMIMGGNSSAQDTPQDASLEYALEELRYAARIEVTSRIANLAALGTIDEGVESLNPAVLDNSAAARRPALATSRSWDLLERALHGAAHQGRRVLATLEYQQHLHTDQRQERLQGIRFDHELRYAFRDLMRHLDKRQNPIMPFERWENRLYRALFTSTFANPADYLAMPDPRRNPNGILSEAARLTGVSTTVLFRVLAGFMEYIGQNGPAESINTPAPAPKQAGNVVSLDDQRNSRKKLG